MNEITLRERLQKYRADKGLSQQDLANQLGVGKITIIRWENGTSRPSPLAAEKLNLIGFGELKKHDTKQISTPRLSYLLDLQELRDGVRKRIRLNGKAYEFDPAPYVINGPEDQLPFFETLYNLQEVAQLPSPREYTKRLSLVARVSGVGSTAQYDLERPKDRAKHWNPNYGSHGWHRYVGRFPPHLIRGLLNYFGARRGETVCDPFVGSGTTLVESRLLGFKSLGIEICPLSALITRTKSKFPMDTASLEALTDSLPRFYNDRWKECVGNGGISNLTHERVLRRKGNLIKAFPNYEKWLTPEALLGTSIVLEFAMTLEDFARDAACCALSSRMRSIGNVDVDVVRAEYRKYPRVNVDVLKLVQTAIRRMIKDIEQMVFTHSDLLSRPEDVEVMQNDMRAASIPPSSIDYIITSPPYGVESLSYLRTHLLSYRCLEPILQYDPYTYDSRFVGSEYLNGQEAAVTNSAAANMSSSFVKNFMQYLDSEKAHPRTLMMAHFFDDMVEVADRFSRWLRPGGRIAFIIGNKKMGENVIPTDKIISEIFGSFGLELNKVIAHKLKCNNTNSEVPWQERTIQEEYVMIFTRRNMAD